MADAVSQYLERHAEPETELAQQLPGVWDHVVVVPAYDEDPDFADGLFSNSAAAGGLAIVVVNATDDAPEAAHRTNAELLEALAGRDSVVVIDRASAGRRLPRGQGVGLARKIGCDLALAAHVAGAIESPWIHWTDCDVTLPPDYLSMVGGAPDGCAAAVFRFRHDTPDTVVGRALREYEASLRYYVLGLASAGSPYAFQMIGSSMAVRADAYAKVRGVPPRQAAEDFYMLNKLAKVGTVWRAPGEPIRIAARRSVRVPFGTGAATNKIADAMDAGEIYRTYDPRSFACVAEAIAAVERGERPGALTAWALDQLGASDAIDKARRNTRNQPAFVSRMREWLDAFRTRKLIHLVRDRELPPVPLSEALERAPFCPDRAEQLEAAELRLPPGPAPVLAAHIR